ncbi:hypothetical protein SAMN04487934_101352 [Eubacterium ruminantium]|nr:hypothetical protein SAMN04487934_101352 [Eubacterium ruminantium]
MEKKKPIRKCVGCNTSKLKSEMYRIIRTGEGEILLDKTGRMNGRGAYICKDKKCIEKAAKSNSLSKAFGIPVSAEIYEGLMEGFSENG